MSPPPSGLSSEEAARRLRDQGGNELPRARRRTLTRIVLDAGREPMFQLLVAGAVLYLLIGNRGEAALLSVFVVVTIGISVVQQQRTERVLDSLRELASPQALVLRDGRTCRIPARELVQGDWLILSAGDRVPADARVRSCQALMVDESLLTGESVPVRKAHPQPSHPGGVSPPEAAPEPGGDDQPWIWAGTLVVGGQGLGEVTATGPRSRLGGIGREWAQTQTPPSPLALQTRRLVRRSALGAAVISLGLVAAFMARGEDPVRSLLAGITLAMSLLPEEFTLILTVFMAMGAWRLSAVRVLSRHPAAIEALGAVTVLCSDKTGTMTLNRMAVAELCAREGDGLVTWRADSEDGSITPSTAQLLGGALLASPATTADPMERALQTLGEAELAQRSAPPGWALRHAWGLDEGLMAMTQVWDVPGEDTHTVAAKGAPEAIASLCHMQEPAARTWRDQADAMATRGLRVIAVATGTIDPSSCGNPKPELQAQPQAAGAAAPNWPRSPRDIEFRMLGLVGLADPLRPGVAEAVRQCREAGIRVALITGDHARTALAVAQQAGLPTANGVLTGPEIDSLDDPALAQRAATVCVFARVQPSHKARLVRALQSQGEVVAMTGDGVNDAPALKAAHVGIAMGGRGTDVARESSSLVLLDDSFGAIVQGLRLGRRILDNVRKAMAFVLAVHVPIAGLSLLPLLSGAPPLLTPVHIAFLELLIDPVCSIVFEAEPEEAGLMTRPPRRPGDPVISARLVRTALTQGGLTLAAAAVVYLVAVPLGWSPAMQRTAAFAALVLGILALILSGRSQQRRWWTSVQAPHPALWWAVGLCLALLGAVLWMPAIGSLFGFVPLDGEGIAVAGASALTLLIALELAKKWAR